MALGLIAAGLGLAGSLVGASSAKSAAKKQAKAQREAIATQEKYLSPYANAGAAGLAGLQDFINQGANFADTQAFKDIINTQRAGGQALSGNTLTRLVDYYGNNFRNQRLNELGFLTNTGARAAGDLAAGIGGLQQNIGDARATGTLGAGANYAGGLGSIGSFLGMLRPNNLGGQPQVGLGGQTPQQFYSQPPPQPFGTFNTGIGPFGGG